MKSDGSRGEEASDSLEVGVWQRGTRRDERFVGPMRIVTQLTKRGRMRRGKGVVEVVASFRRPVDSERRWKLTAVVRLGLGGPAGQTGCWLARCVEELERGGTGGRGDETGWCVAPMGGRQEHGLCPGALSHRQRQAGAICSRAQSSSVPFGSPQASSNCCHRLGGQFHTISVPPHMPGTESRARWRLAGSGSHSIMARNGSRCPHSPAA